MDYNCCVNVEQANNFNLILFLFMHIYFYESKKSTTVLLETLFSIMKGY